jgi:kinetochore protein Nuf2
MKCEEATKEYNTIKSEVESKRHDLEARQRRVEAVLSEVRLYIMLNQLILI